jgi:hypothetical protein
VDITPNSPSCNVKVAYVIVLEPMPLVPRPDGVAEPRARTRTTASSCRSSSTSNTPPRGRLVGHADVARKENPCPTTGRRQRQEEPRISAHELLHQQLAQGYVILTGAGDRLEHDVAQQQGQEAGGQEGSAHDRLGDQGFALTLGGYLPPLDLQGVPLLANLGPLLLKLASLLTKGLSSLGRRPRPRSG